MNISKKALLSLLLTAVIFQTQAKMCKTKGGYKSHDTVAVASDNGDTYTCEYTQSGAIGKDEKNIACKYEKTGELKPKQDKECPEKI